MSQQQNPDHDQDTPVKSVKGYVQYSDIAFRMGATIFIGVFLGKKLDEWTATKHPYFMMIFTLLGVFTGIYLVIRRLK